ncbi:trigger factor [Candidatus Falkowbacteria bacterium]|nr:trigger factor [Candidatus Falkowbacteria bacterium]
MTIKKGDIKKGELVIEFELTHDEFLPFIEQAAEHISEERKIKGFRPGKAPLSIVKAEVGEMFVYQYAAQICSEKTCDNYIVENKLELIDNPKVEYLKIAPNNPFLFKATFMLLPAVELCDYTKLTVKPSDEIKVEGTEIDKIINDLLELRAKEVVADRPAKNGDLVHIDLATFVDMVPIEGGQAKKYSVVIGKGQMIPGFEEKLIDQKAGDELEFDLRFPKDYHNKNIADKIAHFKIKMLSVFERTLPTVDEEFAKSLGFKSLEMLRKNLGDNVKMEKERDANAKKDREIIDLLAKKSKFEDIPDALIDSEAHKMVHELEDNVARQGLKFADYLQHMHKTEADLRIDFSADAIKRIQASLIVRNVADKENIQATDEEIKQEVECTIAMYKLQLTPENEMGKITKYLRGNDYRRYVENIIKNRKALERLKQIMVQK